MALEAEEKEQIEALLRARKECQARARALNARAHSCPPKH